MALPKSPRVIALANQKGGVGKTTTAINLGTALAAIGEEVLIVDLDPQGNASTGLGIDRKSREVSTYDMLLGEATVANTAIPTSVPRVSVAPSTLDLLGVELEIADQQDRAFRLRKALFGEGEDDPIRPRNYSYVLIDCPPSLNLLTINALTAAHSILVPLQCEFFALEGLSQLLSTDRSRRTCGRTWATRSTRRSFRGTCACRRRRRTASRCCSTTSTQAAARPT
jgi:chromosome partitioning protein